MPRLNTDRRKCTGLVGVNLLVTWSVALATCACLPVGAWAQASKSKKGLEKEHKTGTVAHVEKKGKAAILTIEESDGEKFDVMVTAKTHIVIKGGGDVSFFKHSPVFVTADDVVMNPGNKYLFGKKFTIHLGNKTPAEAFAPSETNPNVYTIAGPVVDSADDSFTFEALGTPYKVGFEQNAAIDVSVESTDPEHAAVGSAVEVEGTTKAGKFLPSAITVTLEKPLVADDVFAADKKSAKSKSKTASKKTSKADKADKSTDKGDEPAAGNDPFKKDSNDPFGVGGGDKKGAKKKPAAPKKDKKAANNDSDNN
ncbi:MAG TPA: hypothetical protein VGH74_21170 [Planctomycetaceae bacterium]|jgi:hypothetical protein